MQNVKAAAKHAWGESFKDALSKVKKKYPNANHTHDKNRLTFIVEPLTKTNKLRERNDASAPTTKVASSVATSYNSDHSDCTNVSALSAGKSKSSGKSQCCKRGNKSKVTSRSGKACRSRSQSAHGNKSQDPCTHCIDQGYKGFIDYRGLCMNNRYKSGRCTFDSTYKGYRTEFVCHKMGIEFKQRKFLSPCKGGYVNPTKGPNGERSQFKELWSSSDSTSFASNDGINSGQIGTCERI